MNLGLKWFKTRLIKIYLKDVGNDDKLCQEQRKLQIE